MSNNLYDIVEKLEEEYKMSPFYCWANKLDISPKLPYYLYIELTNVCNLRCVHCPQRAMTREKGFMDFEKYKKLIDEIAPHVHAIGLFKQGESLLHPKMIDMLRYAKEKGLRVEMFTNAMLLDNEKNQAIVEAGLDLLTFTFTGEEESYVKIHQKGEYKKVIENILNMIKIKKELKSSRPEIHAQIIKYPETSEQEMDRFYKLFKNEVPVDYAYPLNLIYYPGVFDDGVKPNGFPPDPSSFPVCIFPWLLFGISWNGNAVPCVFDGNERVIIGNVFSEGFKNVWYGQKLRDFRRAFIEHNFSYFEKKQPLCSVCSILWDPLQQKSSGFSAPYTYPYARNEDVLKITEKLLNEIKKTPTNIEARYGLGLTYLIKGDVRNALIEWHKIFSRAPYSLWAERARQHLKIALNNSVFK